MSATVRETPPARAHEVQLSARVRHVEICEKGRCEHTTTSVRGDANHHHHSVSRAVRETTPPHDVGKGGGGGRTVRWDL